MTDAPNTGEIAITEEMVERALEFFADTRVAESAAETSYPEFVLDLLTYAVLGQKPWAEEFDDDDEEEAPALRVVAGNLASGGATGRF